MATHFSICAWEIPWTEEPDGLQFMGSQSWRKLVTKQADYHCSRHFFSGEGNGTHSSTLAWKIPWTEELGRLQSMGWLRVGHD